ncbi:acyl-CoA dehydrogenase family protein [Mycobacterium sp. CVI_P3]|uniref:Acyl-CoA dehydrogenase family protein n=1 Tax=Mycobacterium pinniadriaticum TaxID=2994102 RepID=A0ABT3SEN1_9MYCO|nr:acyl-CoA dehydrogenase family protein [Mycobacterium pinniadriaticum]MCX2931653.1 acyl-CoA dehydrogenase family protein [Mycobacterium pinniadriaticum]MCX2937955.1 acyl-CoA dehydrogenase family protein [Mycobacterium pinniadriaticum]
MTTSWLAGGIFDAASDRDDDLAGLRTLVEDIGHRATRTDSGQARLRQDFDKTLWTTLVDSGLSHLSSSAELQAGPVELAIVLHGLARHNGAVPIAETDLLGSWLATTAGLPHPGTPPLTVAIAAGNQHQRHSGRVSGIASDAPWIDVAEIVLAVRDTDRLLVTAIAAPATDHGYNLAGEPRATIAFDVPESDFVSLDARVGDELIRRGAWARCVQILGALDTAAELTVAHTHNRNQFGRSLSKFQSVQHALARMAGELERARASVTLAVAAAEGGFDSPQTEYAVTAAKVTLGEAVDVVTTTAHQLHGAVGVTVEHDLWMSTMRARSWIDEFGSTAHYARRLGEVTMHAAGAGFDPWDALIGTGLDAWGPPQ